MMQPHTPINDSDLQYPIPDEHDPSTAVVEAVAAATDARPASMTRLYDAIDPDALDALLDPDHETARSPAVSFEYCGCRVTATAETIAVQVPD